MLTTIPESSHVLLTGYSVPTTAVNLAYLDYPAMSPESCVTIVPNWQSLAGNEDNAALGTRRIGISSLMVGDNESWWPTLTPGSFYWSETVQQYLDRGENLDFSPNLDYPEDDILRYEYTLSPMAAIANAAPGLEETIPFTGCRTDTGWWALDLNPLPGHMCYTATDISTDEVVNNAEDPVLDSMGRIVVLEDPEALAEQWIQSRLLNDYNGVDIYLWPARIYQVHEEENGTLTETSRYNALTDLTDLRLLSWNLGSVYNYYPRQALKLARIYTRPQTARARINVYDSRQPGGGLTTDTTPTNPELYFDLSHYDGPPIPGSCVVVLRASSELIAAHGAEVLQAAAEKHIAAGVVCVVREL